MDWKNKPWARKMLLDKVKQLAEEHGISYEEALNSLVEFTQERIEFEEARKQHQKDGHSEAMARLLADMDAARE